MEPRLDSDYKLVLVVNSELKMGKGKVAAQVYVIISTTGPPKLVLVICLCFSRNKSLFISFEAPVIQPCIMVYVHVFASKVVRIVSVTSFCLIFVKVVDNK